MPFLRFDREIRTVICTTNAIESINARLRRAVNARGHFPTEQAALKCLYLAIMSLDPTGKGRKRWTNRWKAALNAFDITFDGRLSADASNNRDRSYTVNLTDPPLDDPDEVQLIGRPRNSSHSSSVGVRYSWLGRSVRRRARKARWPLMASSG